MTHEIKCEPTLENWRAEALASRSHLAALEKAWNGDPIGGRREYDALCEVLQDFLSEHDDGRQAGVRVDRATVAVALEWKARLSAALALLGECQPYVLGRRAWVCNTDLELRIDALLAGRAGQDKVPGASRTPRPSGSEESGARPDTSSSEGDGLPAPTGTDPAAPASGMAPILLFGDSCKRYPPNPPVSGFGGELPELGQDVVPEVVLEVVNLYAANKGIGGYTNPANITPTAPAASGESERPAGGGGEEPVCVERNGVRGFPRHGMLGWSGPVTGPGATTCLACGGTMGSIQSPSERDGALEEAARIVEAECKWTDSSGNAPCHYASCGPCEGAKKIRSLKSKGGGGGR